MLPVPSHSTAPSACIIGASAAGGSRRATPRHRGALVTETVAGQRTVTGYGEGVAGTSEAVQGDDSCMYVRVTPGHHSTLAQRRLQSAVWCPQPGGVFFFRRVSYEHFSLSSVLKWDVLNCQRLKTRQHETQLYVHHALDYVLFVYIHIGERPILFDGNIVCFHLLLLKYDQS